MKKLSIKVIWLLILILFLIAVGLLFLLPHTNDPLTKILIVIVVVIFILITILIQLAAFRSFSTKRLIKYKEMEYSAKDIDLDQRLTELKYIKTNKSYGASYLLIKDKKAYKISIINDSYKYFDESKEENNSSNVSNKKLDECKTFTGIEIFNEIDEKNLNKLADFTIQTKNVFYMALVKLENNNYKCLNYENIKEEHKDSYNNILKDLQIEEIK